MISSIRNWVTAIAAVSIGLALLDAITPKNSAGRFASLCGSLILTFVVLSPITDFSFSEGSFDAWKYDDEIEEYVERAVKENNNLEKVIIGADKTE